MVTLTFGYNEAHSSAVVPYFLEPTYLFYGLINYYYNYTYKSLVLESRYSNEVNYF